MRHVIAVVLTALVLVGACSTSGSDAPETPRYTPVPDETIFSSIRAIPGVERADLSFNGTAPSHSYLARITVADGADAQTVLDTIYAKLWQGRRGADITLEAQQAGAVVRLDAFGGGPVTRRLLQKRFGPQPGDGTPPDD